MSLFIGLGNPDKHYHSTRHNAGWVVVEALLKKIDIAGQFQPKKQWQTLLYQRGDVVLALPTTYMNDSGVAVAQMMKYLPERVTDQTFVIFDDLDIELGQWKIQFGKGPKVHNGLQSIYQHLGSQQLWHVRVGVDGRAGDRTLAGSEYVLQPFLASEKEVFEKVTAEVVAELQRRLTMT